MTLHLEALTFDCTDAAALAGFWSTLLDQPVDDGATESFASIGMSDDNKRDPAWVFINVPEVKTTKNRCHPDLVATDHAGAVGRAIAAGATRLGDFDEGGTRWTTLADPAGNEFDIVAA